MLKFINNRQLLYYTMTKKDKKIIKTIDITEGQMLTFPASMMHRSPPNTMDDEKIIISFNTCFDELYK